jgi:hypothetical protein
LVFAAGRWFAQGNQEQGAWQPLPEWTPASAEEFVLSKATGAPVGVQLPWQEVRQIVRHQDRIWIATAEALFALTGDTLQSIPPPPGSPLQQLAVSPHGALVVANGDGLWREAGGGWRLVGVSDRRGRTWATGDVLGVVFDTLGRLWFATRAGVGCQTEAGWRFYEGKDGLPASDFTRLAAGPDGEVWFGTKLGVIRYEGEAWHYRQGPRWLPSDEIQQVWVDPEGTAWLATSKGLGRIERRPMDLAEKAELYEEEITSYVKRTPHGFVAEAVLRRAGDKASADPQDSDNDGLWTAMYGAGECFGYAATGDEACLHRAKRAFEALRFLQKVTQGGQPSPPNGYVARTVRPVEWPDPNVGRLDRDRAAQKSDSLWKVIDPRWPRSADGLWFWKCDTSSDELDGHYFFYPLYFDMCAKTEAERERVREVVADLTDHLLEHHYVLSVPESGSPLVAGARAELIEHSQLSGGGRPHHRGS